MLKSDVLEHFDHSPVAVARAINITRSAVNQWTRVVPLDKAIRLQAATKGELCVDLSLYEGLPTKVPQIPGRARRHAIA